MISDDTRLVEIYRARGLPDAHVVRLRLEELGIPVLIENELLQGVVGELPFGWPTSPRVMVPEDQAEQARAEVLNHVSTAPPVPPGTDRETACLSCGAELSPEGICPACGWSFESPENGSPEPTRELPSLWEVMLRAAGRKPDPK